ncbi:MAG: XRE family transcriptional regulator [Thalassobius sp.]|nr:XRE family transcriptional regulator [Thalassovita sp.]
MQHTEYLTVWIGTKIKEIRKSHGLKLGDLAEKTGISIAMLSKIENGRVFPTLPSLFQIVATLEVDLNEFFSDLKNIKEFPGYILKKKEDYTPLSKEEESEGFNYELILNHTIDRSSMEVSILTLSSRAKRETVSTSGFELLYVLKGEVEFELGRKRLQLKEDDTLFFDGNIPHVPHNKTASEAKMLVIYFITLQ